MTNGATYAGNIYQGDFDTWTFTATQGDYIALSMGAVSPISAHFAPWIRLVSPTGALLGNSATGQGAADIAATAPTSGTYTVIVGSYLSGYYDGTGNYLLTLTRGRGGETAGVVAQTRAIPAKRPGPRVTGFRLPPASEGNP